MKKFLFNIALVFAAFTGVQATAQEVGAQGATITLDKEAHDYGTIQQGADGTCVFSITNNGTEPLIISLCKPSCGCTTPDCPKEPIAPGKTVKFTVKYDTNRVGPINKSITISSNATNEPSKIIRITGNVVAPETTGTPTN